MRLHRITAQNNHKAMAKINEMLGPNALIYSTKMVPEGVEIVAGLPHSDDPKTLESLHSSRSTKFERLSIPDESNQTSIDKLSDRLNRMNEAVIKISSHLDNMQRNDFYVNDDDQTIKRNHLFYYMNKNGFRGQFCHQFIKEYLWSRELSQELDMDDVNDSLLSYIQASVLEPIDDVNICALIGPTGVGKTTTITKLANRYIKKYNRESVGLITTDYQDITIKNQLVYYSNKFKIDLEYANTAEELSMAIAMMKDKEFILIDTYGVSQRDSENVEKLRELLEGQGSNLASYVTLPCNVQESILDDIARVFTMKNTRGCILTKQDESNSIAPAVGTSITHKLPISYVCHGQDIYKDIEVADSEIILNQILVDKMNNHVLPVTNLENKLIEGKYD